MLLTTQYLEEADELAHDIVVVDHGRVIAHGTPQELKEASRGARLEVTLAEPHAAAVGAMAPLVAGPVAVSDDGRHLSAGVDSSTGSGHRRSCGRSMRRECWWTTSRCGSRRSTTCSSRSRAATSKRTAPPRATSLGLRVGRVRRSAAVPLLVPPVPSGPARAVTNWKEYAHDDDHLDAVGHRVRPPARGRDVPRLAGGHLGHDPAQPRAHLPGADAALGRDDPAAAVHGAVRLHLRRRHPDPGRRQLRRLPAGRHSGAEPDDIDHGDGDRPQHRPARGHDRPLPHAAHVALRGAGRALRGRLPDVRLVRRHRGLTGLAVGWRPGAERHLGRRRVRLCCCSSPTRWRGSRPASG